MGSIQKAFDAVIADTPRLLLIKKVEQKLQDAGIDDAARMAEMLTERMLAAEGDTLEWREGDEADGEDVRDVTITITDEDLAEIEEAYGAFIRDQLPSIIRDVSASTARKVLGDIKEKWADDDYEDAREALFEFNLDQRWGEAFDSFRLLLTLCRERGEETYKRLGRSRARRGRTKREVLIRVHGRACQVAAEIITLLEHGFADGAAARWRTLHEIEVIGLILSEGDDDLAERYLAHQAIEDWQAMKAYDASREAMGWREIPVRERRRVERAQQLAVAHYGKTFANKCGWASQHLGKLDPTFRDLEAAGQRAAMRSIYKSASYSVHGGPKGDFYRLGLLDEQQGILTGASNAGLDDPGMLAAHSLTCITGLLYSPRMSLDDIIALNTLLLARDEAVQAFQKAGRRLLRDHRKQRKAEAS